MPQSHPTTVPSALATPGGAGRGRLLALAAAAALTLGALGLTTAPAGADTAPPGGPADTVQTPLTDLVRTAPGPALPTATPAPVPSGTATGVPAVPVLPAPTGPLPVGAVNLHLVDASRADPWAPENRRELMVTLWYPTRSPAGARARYMTPAESTLIVAAIEAGGTPSIPPDLLSRIRTHAAAGAPPLRNGLPLVILSPGFGFPRSSLTSLSEYLASRGYAVAAVDHTYESYATTFPDGHTTTCKACGLEGAPKLVPAIRSADASFVIDRLTGAHPVWGPPGLLDATRIGMAGHSIGGNSSAQAMVDDPRIDAGANLDGAFIAPLSPGGLARPFMLLGAEEYFRPGGPGEHPSWRDNWSRLTGWKRWATVTGAKHESFTDYSLLFEQLGVPTAELPGTRAVQITRAYVRTFFDLHLRGLPSPLLNGHSPRYPEVKIWKTD